MSTTIAIINGPNLNLLGERNPDVYGVDALPIIVQRASDRAVAHGYAIRHFQSNSEGEIVNEIQHCRNYACGIVINAAAYSHTSIAIRDALEIISLPIIEVHLSNISNREPFRAHSFVSSVAKGVIFGLGGLGYVLAVDAVIELCKREKMRGDIVTV